MIHKFSTSVKHKKYLNAVVIANSRGQSVHRANLVSSNKGNSFLQCHAVKLIFQHLPVTLKVWWTSQNI